MNTNEPLKEVPGRKNFGAAHALMTTPQPCVMIATWDKLQPIVFDAASMSYRAVGAEVGKAWGAGKVFAA